MLEFTDQPYKFFPPRPNRLIIKLAQWLNHSFALPGPNHRIGELKIEGQERLQSLIDAGANILFLPNHPTHSDAQVMSEVHRRLGLPSPFMAAYDVFLRRKLNAWVMQRTGSFSIDREGSDRKAMAAGIGVIKQAGSLTVFPEGNVYFTNDRVTPFLEGAAFMGIKAQKDLGDKHAVLAVPVAIKFTHLIDQREAVLHRLSQAAKIIGCEFDHAANPLHELRRIGQLALERHLETSGFDAPEDGQPIDEALEQATSVIVAKLEDEIGLTPKDGDDLHDRLRKIRSRIHRIRIAEDSQVDTQTAARWADQAILAIRMLGYSGNYVAEHPTLDRFAETAEKLIEDLLSKSQKPYGKRRAIVRLCEPIDLREHLDRGAVEAVTDQVELDVQAAIDDINASHRSAGSQLFAADPDGD